MISLEQVQLLETRTAKAIEYMQILSAENSTLVSEKAGLHDKLEASQKRLDELEMLVLRFKEDQGRIEDGILAALDRLSQFEEAFENSLKEKNAVKKTSVKEPAASKEKIAPDETKKEFFEIKESETPNDEDEASAGPALPTEPIESDSSSDGELDIF
ncbi:MAG: cell division protein ZapB [Treponema sp.]|nr:cell division protein ZapB [Treponema sp.]